MFCVFQILQSDNAKSVGYNDTSFQCDGSNSTFRVMFKEPVEILPNTSYTACATLKVGHTVSSDLYHMYLDTGISQDEPLLTMSQDFYVFSYEHFFNLDFTLNTLPDNKILSLSKLKADNILNVT